MNMVGTPYKDVHISVSTTCITASGSNVSPGIIIVEPWVVQARLPQYHTKTMVKRKRYTNLVGSGIMKRLSYKKTIVQNVMMAKGGSFGKTGSARGKLNIDGVIELQSIFN